MGRKKGFGIRAAEKLIYAPSLKIKADSRLLNKTRSKVEGRVTLALRLNYVSADARMERKKETKIKGI